MRTGLDRRLEQFQAKVQQKITLADDEITRCQEYLDQLRAKIAESEDQIRRFQLSIQQREDEKGGSKRRKVAANHAQAAAMNRDHQAAIAEALAHFQQEDNALRANFDAQFAEMERYIQVKADERSGGVQDKMTQIGAMIAKLREKLTQSANAVDTASQVEIEASLRLEFDRIEALERHLQSQNSDRLANLVQERTQLSQCVRTLEEMEQKHQGEMANLKQRLDVQDRKYREKLRAITENHARQRDSVARKVQDAETRAGQARKSLKRVERHFKREIGVVGADNEALQREFADFTTAEMNRRREESELLEAEAQLKQASSELQKREDVLRKIRAQAQATRREVARIKHEAVLAKRRAALDLA
jgi:chromosome segregation ATPase